MLWKPGVYFFLAAVFFLVACDDEQVKGSKQKAMGLDWVDRWKQVWISDKYVLTFFLGAAFFLVAAFFLGADFFLGAYWTCK